MSSRAQRVKTGVLPVTIRMVRMMRGAGAWRGLDGTVTGGAPRAQVGTALTTLPILLPFDTQINVLVTFELNALMHMFKTCLFLYVEKFTIPP